VRASVSRQSVIACTGTFSSESVRNLHPQLKEFNPHVILAIGGGGFHSSTDTEDRNQKANIGRRPRVDKDKRGVLPDGVQYFAGDDVPDFWNCYPWDAADYNQTIGDHEELAKIVQCGR